MKIQRIMERNNNKERMTQNTTLKSGMKNIKGNIESVFVSPYQIEYYSVHRVSVRF